MEFPQLTRAGATGPIAMAPAAPKAPAAKRAGPTDGLRLAGDGLTSEERQLQAAGLLTPDYARLKGVAATRGREAAIAAGREGKAGPFAPAYGDPAAMLEAARRIAADPELMRLAKDVQPGDVLVQFYPGVVTRLSNGPASHVLICVGKPAEFIEAVGITNLGADGNPAGSGAAGAAKAQEKAHGVRRTTLGEALATQGGFRLVRPAAAFADPAEAKQAVADAIAYAEGQLGQAYDFSFGMAPGQGQYCSGLAAACYAQGAGVALPVDKDPARDKRVLALKAITAALAPDDHGALVLAATRKLAAPKGERQVLDFLVNDVIAGCRTMRPIAATTADRAKTKAMVGKVIDGRAFVRTDALLSDPAAPHEGRVRQLVGALKADAAAIYRESGINGPAALAAAGKLFVAALPHADTLAGMAFGEGDARTKKWAARLDRLAAFKQAHPILGAFLPSRPRATIDPGTISPTDLALSALPHADYALPQ